MMALAAVSGKMMNHSGDVTRIVFEPKYPFEKCGTEDPRVVQHDGVTYLYAHVCLPCTLRRVTSLVPVRYYTAYNCHKAQLSLATSTDPTNPDAWVRHGPLYPHLAWSKSGAVLIRPSPPHYMYFGDSTLIPGLRFVVLCLGGRRCWAFHTATCGCTQDCDVRQSGELDHCHRRGREGQAAHRSPRQHV